MGNWSTLVPKVPVVGAPTPDESRVPLRVLRPRRSPLVSGPRFTEVRVVVS